MCFISLIRSPEAGPPAQGPSQAANKALGWDQVMGAAARRQKNCEETSGERRASFQRGLEICMPVVSK